MEPKVSITHNISAIKASLDSKHLTTGFRRLALLPDPEKIPHLVANSQCKTSPCCFMTPLTHQEEMGVMLKTVAAIDKNQISPIGDMEDKQMSNLEAAVHCLHNRRVGFEVQRMPAGMRGVRHLKDDHTFTHRSNTQIDDYLLAMSVPLYIAAGIEPQQLIVPKVRTDEQMDYIETPREIEE